MCQGRGKAPPPPAQGCPCWIILGIYGEYGKEHGNYYNGGYIGFRELELASSMPALRTFYSDRILQYSVVLDATKVSAARKLFCFRRARAMLIESFLHQLKTSLVAYLHKAPDLEKRSPTGLLVSLQILLFLPMLLHLLARPLLLLPEPQQYVE